MSQGSKGWTRLIDGFWQPRIRNARLRSFRTRQQHSLSRIERSQGPARRIRPSNQYSTYEDQVVAGIDLGSNSFHMIVVRAQDDGRVHILDKIKFPVRLAAGLSEDRTLDEAAQLRALETLELFAQRLRELPSPSVRAVGTNTMRQIKNGEAFLIKAQEALGHEIDIISGPEEARLIYLGVSHSSYFEGSRLVMDIGGGSTEFIIGEGFKHKVRDSMYMGCVSFSKQYFPKGRITEKHFREAELAAQREVLSICGKYKRIGWSRATGASGTLKAVDSVLRAQNWSHEGITSAGLDKLKETLLNAKRTDKINLDGLDPERAPVFVGGVAIVRAAFKILDIDIMDVSEGALREGVAYELLGRTNLGDIRDHTVKSFAERYRVDIEHAGKVEKTAIDLLQQVSTPWSMHIDKSQKYLQWASLLHEIGLSVSYSGHHKHAAYLVKHSEMPGFSREQQAMLATLIGNQRRRMRLKHYSRLASDLQLFAQELTVLLRLAILINRARTEQGPPPVTVTRATAHHLDLTFPEDWLKNHPLTQEDLEDEAQVIEKIGLKLEFT